MALFQTTFVLLKHERQMDLLESVEVPDGGVGDDARDGVEREVGLAGKVVERENVVVEHGEPQHGR